MVRGPVRLAHCGKVPAAKADDKFYCQDPLGGRGVFTDSFELTLTSSVLWHAYNHSPYTQSKHKNNLFKKLMKKKVMKLFLLMREQHPPAASISSRIYNLNTVLNRKK